MRSLTRYMPFALCMFLATSAWAQTATNDVFVATLSGNVTRLNGSTGTTVYSVPQGVPMIDLVKGPDGALYVSSTSGNSVIRVDLATGASLGVFASGGGLSVAVGVAFGPDGNLYVGSQSTSSVLRYDGATGSFIDTFVPSGSGGLSSTEALLFGPDGHLYVTEFSGNRVLRYNGVTGAFLGVFATDPSLSGARSMVFGPDGNLYVAGNFSNNVVRFNGSTGAFMDVFASPISGANGLAFGPDRHLYVVAQNANKVSRFDGTTGAFIDDFASVAGNPIGMMFDFDVQRIATVAGGGTPTPGFCGDGGPATNACLRNPGGVAADATRSVFIADTGNHRIRRVDAAGIITTFAGNGTPAFCGDNGPAISACLNTPVEVAVDANGNLVIADTVNDRIRKVDGAGTITTVAGSGTRGFCGDDGPAISACLQFPQGVAVDAVGNLFIADRNNHRVRRVDAVTGTITTVAGNGTPAFCGDGGPATNACLLLPQGVAVDAAGNLFITDRNNHRVRRVDAVTGIITTVAGNGTPTFCGDGGPAINACLNIPAGVAVDANGNLVIADALNHRIRRVDAAGTITTVAGSGTPGFCGDRGWATSACLSSPFGMAVNPVSGSLLIGDTNNSRVRRVASLLLAPSNLRVTAFTPTQVDLAWRDNSVNETHFRIDRSADGVNFVPIGFVDANVTTFRDANPAAGINLYRVVALNLPAGEVSDPSNEDGVAFGPVIVDRSAGFPEGPARGGFSLNGAARFTGSRARMTPAAFFQRGSLFTSVRIDVRSFSTEFTFQISGGTSPRADGMTFTIQGNNPNALGTDGGGLGYKTLRNSVAIKFDIFNGAGEGDNSTGIFTDGRDPTVREPGLPPEFPDMSIDLGDRMDPNNVDLQSPGGVRVTMSYSGTTLIVAITDLARNVTANQTYTVDIPALIGGTHAYVGFTAGTGGLSADHDVSAWRFESM